MTCILSSRGIEPSALTSKPPPSLLQEARNKSMKSKPPLTTTFCPKKKSKLLVSLKRDLSARLKLECRACYDTGTVDGSVMLVAHANVHVEYTARLAQFL